MEEGFDRLPKRLVEIVYVSERISKREEAPKTQKKNREKSLKKKVPQTRKKLNKIKVPI